MAFFNNDKLLLKFGNEKAISNLAGEYKTYGPLHTIETKLVLANLTTSDVIQSDVTLLPKSALIESVELDVQVAAVGGTSVNVGLMKTDRVTSLGTGALLNAEVTATLVLGKLLIYDATTAQHGTLVGTVLTDPAHITAKVDGTFSAGTLVLRIRYRAPT